MQMEGQYGKKTYWIQMNRISCKRGLRLRCSHGTVFISYRIRKCIEIISHCQYGMKSYWIQLNPMPCKRGPIYAPTLIHKFVSMLVLQKGLLFGKIKEILSIISRQHLLVVYQAFKPYINFLPENLLPSLL